MAGTGREEQGKVVGEDWEGRTGARSGRENVIKPIIARDFIFSLNVPANVWWSGSARTRQGELEPLEPLNAVGAREGNTLCCN